MLNSIQCPTMGMFLVSAHRLDPFCKLRLFRMWDMGTDINPEDETSDPTQYKAAILKYVENEHCAEQWRVQVIKPESILSKNFFPSAMTSQSGQWFFDTYYSSSDDEEYLMCNNVAKMKPGWSDCAARLLRAARLYWNSQPEIPRIWGQVIPNLNEYHSNPMEIRSTLWVPDFTDCWRHREDMHWKYADPSSVAQNIFSIIPHDVGVEASFLLGQDVIGWRQATTTGET